MTRMTKEFKDSLMKKLNIVAMIFVGLALFLCLVCSHEEPEDSITTTIEPFSTAILADGSTEYFFDLSDYDYHYSAVMFYTSHQFVYAYNGGREIYNFSEISKFWTSTPGSSYHFVEINEKMPQIAIIVRPVYDIVANQEITFYIGSAYTMYDNIMSASMPKFFASYLIVIISVAILLYYFTMHEKQHLTRELLHLGLFSFFQGIWFINSTDVSSLTVHNRIFDSLIPYLCLMPIVPSFILFFDSYLGINGKRIKHIIVSYSILQAVVLTILHLTKIAEFRETLIFMQILLGVVAVYLTIGMIRQLVLKKFSKRLRICALGLSLLIIALAVDIANYYIAVGDSDKLGRFVFLIFVFILACDMIHDANEMINRGRRAKQLEVFAITDSMTGLFNRNAFETHAQSEESLDGLVAVVADANGLKACNDTFGHEAGDEYITIVAKIFNEVYGKYGNCYRIGGDEFCCIIQSGKNINMERLKKMFMTKIYTANIDGGHAYDIGVAIGDAKYNSHVDADFKALVKRADECMYEDKKASKASRTS